MSRRVDRRAVLAGVAGAAALAVPAEATAAPDPLLELGRRWFDAQHRSAEANAIRNRIFHDVHPADGSPNHPFVKWAGNLYSDAESIEEAFSPTIAEYGDAARALCTAVVAEQRRRAEARASVEAAAGLPGADAHCQACDEEVAAIEAEIMASTPATLAGVAVMLRVAMIWDGVCDGSAVEQVRAIMAKLPAIDDLQRLGAGGAP